MRARIVRRSGLGAGWRLALLAVVGLSAAAAPAAAADPPPALQPSVVGEDPHGPAVFRFPQGVAVDPQSGGFYVGDQYSGTIQAFDANGNRRFSFGALATRGELGRLGVIGGVAVDRSGRVFVLDSAHDRVQIFSGADGRFLGSFGDSSVFSLKNGGTRPDSGITVSGIAVDQRAPGRTVVVYVADSGRDRVERFALDPNTLRPYGPPKVTNRGTVRLQWPQGLAVDPSGKRLYVADNQQHRIVVLQARTLRKVGAFGAFGRGLGQFRAPYDVGVDASGQVYVADNLNGRVNVFDQRSYAYLGTFGGNGHRIGRFSIVRAVAASPTAAGVLVADTANNRIQRLDRDGAVTGAWGIAGRGPGYLTRPRGVTFGPGGGIAVADSFDHRIALFAADGTYEAQLGRINRLNGFATPGSKEGQYLLPGAVAFDGAGNLWVADTYNSRLVRIDRAGAVAYTSPRGQLSRPRGLASAADGSVYVADTGHGTVLRIAPDGTTTTVRGGLGRPSAVATGPGDGLWATTASSLLDLRAGVRIAPPGGGSWDHPTGLAVGPDGTLYVAEARPKTADGARILRGVPDGNGGRAWDVLATEGSGPAQVIDPGNLALSPDGGTLLVADAGNDRVLRFDAPDRRPPAMQPLRVTIGGGGPALGAVASDPPGIDCGTDCGQRYGQGRTVTLRATPFSGAIFRGWGGACAAAGSAPTCTVSMAAAQQAQADFVPTPPPPVRIRGVRIAPARWHLTRRSGPRSRRPATRAALTIRVTQPATVRLRVLQARTGRRSGGRCVAVRRPDAVRRSQRCTRYATLPGTRRLRLLAGRTTLSITPRFGHRTLRPGVYRLQLTAIDRAGNRDGERSARILITR
ncbi:NHL repeat-containing protein [Patulibacter defluvii]|uniref:NHL repeat-containing protein n=1 Tax=Patulibacter defluvii TaxID=3095358 RepID=UPI002A75CF4A|nr:NHL repeat-containing protein [Patulibacter sp. DM4]